MRVHVEHRGEITILRYLGLHGCSDADHRYGEQVGEFISARCDVGCDRFLIDVRQLDVVYGSGISDLFQTWQPVLPVRSAFLWDPSRSQRGGATQRWRVLRDLQDRRALAAFEDEDQALAFLMRPND
jgi:hypothetical protein